jgi:hypothetical protein
VANVAVRKGGHELSVTIDPRRHDAVLFDLDVVVTDTPPQGRWCGTDGIRR